MKNKITNTLRRHLKLNLSRIKAASLMISAMLDCRSVQLSTLARHFAGKASAESSLRRLQRLLSQIEFPQSQIATINLKILGLHTMPVKLIFDRTNWKFGKVHINILFLCVAFKGLAVPLFFKLLTDKKQGNSSYLDRIDLIERFLATFGQKKIQVVLGDREFAGKRWIIWLRRKRIPFVMRLSEKITHISNDGENFHLGSKIFSDLRRGQSRQLGYCLVGKTDSYKTCVSAKRTLKGNLIVLAHSENIKNPGAYYRKRWQIESMFRTLKTGGFNLESTHVKNPRRIENLVAIMAMAFCFAYGAGMVAIEKIKPKAKNNGYLPKSIIRFGLDLIFEMFFSRRGSRAQPHVSCVKSQLLKIFVV